MAEEMTVDKVEKGLKSFLETGEDWARKPTSVPGVFVVKFPKSKSRPATLGVEFNPVDSSGKPSKRKGLLVRSFKDFEDYRKIINDERVSSLFKGLEALVGIQERHHEEEGVLELS